MGVAKAPVCNSFGSCIWGSSKHQCATTSYGSVPDVVCQPRESASLRWRRTSTIPEESCPPAAALAAPPRQQRRLPVTRPPSGPCPAARAYGLQPLARWRGGGWSPWRGAPRALQGGALASGALAWRVGRRQRGHQREGGRGAQHGVGARGWWKRPFEFPILAWRRKPYWQCAAL
jgi:hypothetical protein